MTRRYFSSNPFIISIHSTLSYSSNSPKDSRTSSTGYSLFFCLKISLHLLINILVIHVLKYSAAFSCPIFSQHARIVSDMASAASSSFQRMACAVLYIFCICSCISSANASASRFCARLTKIFTFVPFSFLVRQALIPLLALFYTLDGGIAKNVSKYLK